MPQNCFHTSREAAEFVAGLLPKTTPAQVLADPPRFIRRAYAANHPDRTKDPKEKKRLHEIYVRVGLAEDLLKHSPSQQEEPPRRRRRTADPPPPPPPGPDYKQEDWEKWAAEFLEDLLRKWARGGQNHQQGRDIYNRYRNQQQQDEVNRNQQSSHNPGSFKPGGTYGKGSSTY